MSSQGVELAVLGLIQQDLAREYKLRQEVWVAEIDFERLLDFPLRSRKFQPISKFPAVERDFSLVVPDELPYARLSSAIAGLALEEFAASVPWTVSEAAQFRPGTTAFCCGSLFRADTHTLTSEEVGAIEPTIARGLARVGGATAGLRIAGCPVSIENRRQ